MTTTTTARRRVCLFGTSANPPTGEQGHLGILRAIAALTDAFDEIRVVPVYSHPFAHKRKLLAPFEHRVQMCRLILEGIGTAAEESNDVALTISQAEQEIYQEKLSALQEQDPNTEPSISIGTADLLEHYQQHDETPTDYTLCLGADTFLDLTGGKWRRTQDILDSIQGRFVVLFRQEGDENGTKNGDDNNSNNNSQKQQLEQAVAKLEATYGSGSMRLLQVPTLGAVSSTLIRKLSREMSQVGDEHSQEGNDKEDSEHPQLQAEQQLKEMVDARVLEYMRVHGLYGFQKEL